MIFSVAVTLDRRRKSLYTVCMNTVRRNKKRGNFSLSDVALSLLREASIAQQLSQSAILENLIRERLSPEQVQGKDWNALLKGYDETATKREGAD